MDTEALCPGVPQRSIREPYVRADGTRIWSLMQLERQLRPEAYCRRRGGYLDRRQAPPTDAEPSGRLA